MALKYVLRNCTVFVDGRGLHGALAKMTLPELNEVTEEHRGGGMDAPIEIALGHEKLEANFELADLDPEVIQLWGLRPGIVKPVTFKGYLAGEDGSDRAAEVHTRGAIKTLSMGDWTPGELAKLTATMRLNYYKLVIGDQSLVEIDVLNGIRVIGGTDQNINMRQALGLA